MNKNDQLIQLLNDELSAAEKHKIELELNTSLSLQKEYNSLKKIDQKIWQSIDIEEAPALKHKKKPYKVLAIAAIVLVVVSLTIFTLQKESATKYSDWNDSTLNELLLMEIELNQYLTNSDYSEPSENLPWEETIFDFEKSLYQIKHDHLIRSTP